MVYPYGAHVVQLKLDADTGGVTIERYLVAFDIGRAVNPMLVEGQIAGGMAQGLGGALYEEFLYSETGEPLSVTFADYLMPTAREVPAIEVIVSEDAPSPLNPLGLKGAGEGGITPVGAAIASAIDDALGAPGAVTQLPVTPQRLKALMDWRASYAASRAAMSPLCPRAPSRIAPIRFSISSRAVACDRVGRVPSVISSRSSTAVNPRG